VPYLTRKEYSLIKVQLLGVSVGVCPGFFGGVRPALLWSGCVFVRVTPARRWEGKGGVGLKLTSPHLLLGPVKEAPHGSASTEYFGASYLNQQIPAEGYRIF